MKSKTIFLPFQRVPEIFRSIAHKVNVLFHENFLLNLFCIAKTIFFVIFFFTLAYFVASGTLNVGFRPSKDALPYIEDMRRRRASGLEDSSVNNSPAAVNEGPDDGEGHGSPSAPFSVDA